MKWIKNTGEKPDGEFFHLHYKNGGYSFHDKNLKRPEIDWVLSDNGFSIVEYQVVPSAPKE